MKPKALLGLVLMVPNPCAVAQNRPLTVEQCRATFKQWANEPSAQDYQKEN
jgi:hypothetical protein